VIKDTNSSGSSNLASPWCLSRWKRWMDIIIASLTLFLLSPLFFVIAFAIAITSGKPIFFRQWRLGRHGREFQVQKFRTMRAAVDGCIGLTQDGDSRVTRIGRWLRRWKLDELPQLYNVLKGEMTLVGPRPDLEQFWLKATAADRRILQLKPGLTGAASVAFHDEERLLATVSPERLTSFYVEQVLPQKAKLDSEYAARATFRSDCVILLQTSLVPFLHQRSMAREIDELAPR
jgi:lipopolysaccharide/colanic/teichoic acid biosynthesis glycosyltransferase